MEKGVSFSSQEITPEFLVLPQTFCENLSKSLGLKSTKVIQVSQCQFQSLARIDFQVTMFSYQWVPDTF